MSRWLATACGTALSAFSALVWAQSPAPAAHDSDDLTASTPSLPPSTVDARRDVPILAFAYTAYGAPSHTIGVQAIATGLVASQQDASLGGGGAVWAAPFERVTLVVDARRGLTREFTPSIAGIVRLYGDPGDGLSVGALGKFKVEGFSGGPNGDEVESEIEAGALLSYVRAAWQLDVNAIGGRGLGDDGETDAELRLRAGRELGTAVRVGVDGQVRMRLSGTHDLPNGRTWDFAAGPQVMVVSNRYFGAVTIGPSTVGLVSSNVGWVASLSVGGTSF